MSTGSKYSCPLCSSTDVLIYRYYANESLVRKWLKCSCETCRIVAAERWEIWRRKYWEIGAPQDDRIALEYFARRGVKRIDLHREQVYCKDCFNKLESNKSNWAHEEVVLAKYVPFYVKLRCHQCKVEFDIDRDHPSSDAATLSTGEYVSKLTETWPTLRGDNSWYTEEWVRPKPKTYLCESDGPLKKVLKLLAEANLSESDQPIARKLIEVIGGKTGLNVALIEDEEIISPEHLLQRNTKTCNSSRPAARHTV